MNWLLIGDLPVGNSSLAINSTGSGEQCADFVMQITDEDANEVILGFGGVMRVMGSSRRSGKQSANQRPSSTGRPLTSTHSPNSPDVNWQANAPSQ